MSKKLRFGVFGLGRGAGLIGNIIDSGAEVVAICDMRPATLAAAKKREPRCSAAAEYADFDSFIQHDMDAVLLANFFIDHTPFAIRAMRAGKHVLSETIPCITLAECVELCRAKEETGKIYGLLENYPYFKSNLEMARLYREGTMGNLVYAEGEYVHPMSEKEQNGLAPGEKHWRNWTPRTYYTTHALAPLMQMTDATPTRVSAMACFQPEMAKGTALNTGDAAAIILCQTDINAVFRITGWATFAPHGNYYRLCCTRGGVETNHTTKQMRLCYNSWCVPEGMEEVNEYDAEWPNAELAELANNAGHGGGDFLSIYYFIRAIEKGEEPYWNVYRSACVSAVAILAWRSVLNNNACYDVPDFRREEDRKKYENDRISPYPDENGRVNISCSSQPYGPTAEDLKNANEYWKNSDFLVK